MDVEADEADYRHDRHPYWIGMPGKRIRLPSRRRPTTPTVALGQQRVGRGDVNDGRRGIPAAATAQPPTVGRQPVQRVNQRGDGRVGDGAYVLRLVQLRRQETADGERRRGMARLSRRYDPLLAQDVELERRQRHANTLANLENADNIIHELYGLIDTLF